MQGKQVKVFNGMAVPFIIWHIGSAGRRLLIHRIVGMRRSLG